MKACLLLFLFFPGVVWAAQDTVFAEVIRAERDHGIPFENIRIIYTLPCNREVYDIVANRYESENTVELGVLLKEAAETTCDMAPSTSVTLRFVVGSGTFPKLVIHGLAPNESIQRMNF